MSNESIGKNNNLIRRIFLIDGIGAVVSTICLGVVLVRFQPYIGMPINVLYVLALIAAIFSIYSWTCYLANLKKLLALKVMGGLNLLYSLTTCVLILVHYEELTILGLSYFILEIGILWVLAFYELKWVRST